MGNKPERIRLATHPYTAKDGHMPMQHICLPEMMEQLEATGSIQQKMIVNFVDRMDDFIIDAVMNDARNQGATEVMLFDRKWVKEAIIEKAEREKLIRDAGAEFGNWREPVKLEAALDSERRKILFRKQHYPDQVSILDYTIIFALEEVLAKLQEEAMHGGAE